MSPLTERQERALRWLCVTPAQTELVNGLIERDLIAYCHADQIGVSSTAGPDVLAIAIAYERAAEVAKLADGVIARGGTRMHARVYGNSGEVLFTLRNPTFTSRDVLTATARTVLDWDSALRTGGQKARAVMTLTGYRGERTWSAQHTLDEIVTAIAPGIPREARDAGEAFSRRTLLGESGEALERAADAAARQMYSILTAGTFGAPLQAGDPEEHTLATLLGDEVGWRNTGLSSHGADSPDLVLIAGYALARTGLIETARALTLERPQGHPEAGARAGGEPRRIPVHAPGQAPGQAQAPGRASSTTQQRP